PSTTLTSNWRLFGEKKEKAPESPVIPVAPAWPTGERGGPGGGGGGGRDVACTRKRPLVRQRGAASPPQPARRGRGSPDRKASKGTNTTPPPGGAWAPGAAVARANPAPA